MQSSYWGYWIVVFGVAIIALMISVQGITTTSTQDYYSLKEIVDASMLESIDYGYYRDYNEVKMNKEKFMEVFIRRLADVMSGTDTYQVNFYEIYEAPPKVSVEIKSKSGTNFIPGDAEGYDVTTRIDAIIQVHSDKDGTNQNDDYNDNDSNDDNSNNDDSNNNDSNNDNSNSADSDDNNSDDNAEDLACTNNVVTNNLLTGVRGVAMKAGVNVYKAYGSNEVLTTLTNDGKVVFTINGESPDKKQWNIEIDGKCGWVENTYLAVNLADYLDDKAVVDIKNSSSSLFKSNKVNGEIINIPNVTGKKLYSSDYMPIAVYSFAEKLLRAAEAANKDGKTIVIYDAYRPNSVTKYVANEFGKVKTDADIGGTSNGYGEGYFLAQTVSRHNTACAVDVTLRQNGVDLTMPSPMHRLSMSAVKYDIACVARRGMCPGPSGFSNNMNQNAKDLSTYMMDVGLDELASEWWHFEDNVCHDKVSVGNFWSNT